MSEDKNSPEGPVDPGRADMVVVESTEAPIPPPSPKVIGFASVRVDKPGSSAFIEADNAQGVAHHYVEPMRKVHALVWHPGGELEIKAVKLFEIPEKTPSIKPVNVIVGDEVIGETRVAL